MQYLTISEFAKLHNISRQAVEDRISRGTLPSVIKDVKIRKKLIPVPDDVKLDSENALAHDK